MRTMGEAAYRDWFLERLTQTPLPLYFACLLGETVLTALPGAALVWWSEEESVAFAIGCGIVAYAGDCSVLHLTFLVALAAPKR